MHSCYKIYDYFEFQFFTYHLSSAVHSATLIYKTGLHIICPCMAIFNTIKQKVNEPRETITQGCPL